MTYPRDAQPVGAGSGGADAEKAAFLRDLRALRDRAGLGSRDLAARAHFPEDTLKTAEAGPALPSLPVLQAYVRGCGAGETEWEDRWRRLNDESSSSGNALPTRAPATSRPPARMMPFPESQGGRSAAEQDAIGFGLARVARGLAPIEPDAGPTIPSSGVGGAGGFGAETTFDGFSRGTTAPSADPGYGIGGDSAATGADSAAGGWFDPAPRAPAPPPAAATPPAPAAPEVSPGEPTVQYPAMPAYQAPGTSYSGTYSPPSYETPAYEAPSPSYEAPSYDPPEMFRTPAPAPEPPSAPPPTPPTGITPGAGSRPAGMPPGSGTPGSPGDPPAPGTPASLGGPATLGTPGTPVTQGMAGPPRATGPSATSGPLAASAPSAGAANAHAAPAPRRRRVSTTAIAAVLAVIVIAVVLWLVLAH
ncbi:MAG: helix-turn-helix domain-containing protein [Actinobacteria bacterium]|nr:helix-turn-helix domain-containing protein [Actinomycetota bacterium]